MKSRWILPSLAVTAALALPACGSETEAGTSTPAETTSTTEETEATTETTAADDQSAAEAPAGAAEFTPQGTGLAIGDKAVVPYRAGAEKGAVGVTVTGIDKGAPTDLAPLQLGSQVEGLVPYYIRITVTNESGNDFGGSSLVTLEGLLADGSEAGGVYSVPKSFAPCGKGYAENDFAAPGASYETCSLALAPASAEVTGVAYSVDTYDDAAPAGAQLDYATAPITWK